MIAVLALTACGGDAITASGDASGSYSLRTIDGQLLPFTFPTQNAGDPTTTVTAADFTLSTDGTFTESATVTASDSTTPTTTTCSGTYSLGRGVVFFTEPAQANPDCAGSFAGGWNGSSTLSFSINVGNVGVVAVYQK